MSELSFGLNFYCHFLFSSKILHCELWNVGNHCFSFLIDMWLEPLLIDTPILRTLSSQKQYIQRFTYWIWVLWFRHPTGGILYKVVYRDRLRSEVQFLPFRQKKVPFSYTFFNKNTFQNFMVALNHINRFILKFSRKLRLIMLIKIK